jgi:hypothetical protein
MIGERTLIKKLWVKFDGMDIDCVCDEHHRKCKDKACKEYVVKFTEIKRSKGAEQIKGLEKDGQLLEKAVNDLKKYSTELKKSITKFKI